MSTDDMEQDLLSDYFKLHDSLSDMIEGGRLTVEHIPDDYSWLLSTLLALALAGDRLDQARLREEGP